MKKTIYCLLLAACFAFFLGCGSNRGHSEKPENLDPLPKNEPISDGAGGNGDAPPPIPIPK